jgi:hypothetical protein
MQQDEKEMIIKTLVEIINEKNKTIDNIFELCRQSIEIGNEGIKNIEKILDQSFPLCSR